MLKMETADCCFQESSIYNERPRLRGKHGVSDQCIKGLYKSDFFARITTRGFVFNKSVGGVLPRLIRFRLFNEWKCLNVSPDDTARMCNWLYETTFLAEDAGRVHFATSQIK